MTPEFTGERVVPGQVDSNLWNEHYARYAFAARLARGRRTLDAACGAGYGSADLAQTASSVTAFDIDPGVVSFARQAYGEDRIRWAGASCTALPFRDGSFDLVVAFELIEHLRDWPGFLAEAKRVLSPSGLLILSTPNRVRYQESRAGAGPNPFHVHEFDFPEFRDALAAYFPHCSFFAQDHTEGIFFRSLERSAGSELRMDAPAPAPESCDFFLAVCALSPQTGSPHFLYLPEKGGLLEIRNQTIAMMREEIVLKDAWLADSQASLARLNELHQDQALELARRTEWADRLNAQIAEARERLGAIESDHRSNVESISAGYEQRMAALETELQRALEWGRENERHLTSELAAARAEHGRCLEALHEVEQAFEERTAWALSLDRQRETLEERARKIEGLVALAQSSRWLRFGRIFGIGPELR